MKERANAGVAARKRTSWGSGYAYSSAFVRVREIPRGTSTRWRRNRANTSLISSSLLLRSGMAMALEKSSKYSLKFWVEALFFLSSVEVFKKSLQV